MGGGDNGYRIPLAPLLQAHVGPAWDYVGPLYTNGGKHAGYNGWTIEQLLTVLQYAE